MRIFALMAAAGTMALASPSLAETPLAPGIWTNVEDRYFAKEEGRETPPPMAFRIADDGRWQPIDPFGEALDELQNIPLPGLGKRSGGGWEVNGSELRQARPFTCWMSVRKHAGNPDGSEASEYKSGIKIHDQGGRAMVGGNGAPEVMIRLRSVTWAKGSANKPALVIYMHRDDPERATSYSWAETDSRTVGINLRWIQGSCTRDNETLGATEETLAAAGAEWNAAVQAQDWKAVRALYADDAWLMTDKAPALKSADAIVSYLRRFADQGAKTSFQFAPEDVQVDYPYGFVTAPYWMTVQVPGREEPIRSAGRSVLIYKWLDGGWKLWRDMDNTSPDITLDDTP